MIQIIAIIASSICWHLGGQGYKWARSFVVPAVLAVSKAILLGNFWALLYFGALWAMIAGFSYGLSAPPHKFWVWVMGKGADGNEPVVEALTRATCGLFWSLAALVFAFITGNWVAFGLYVIVCTILVTLFGLHNKVRVSELGTGASVALSILI